MMNMKTLIIGAIMAAFVVISQASTETLDQYIDKLAAHPQVTQLLQQSTYFSELSTSEMGLPDLEMIIGVDNVPVDNPEFDRFLPTSKVIGFKQSIPNYSLRKAKSGRQTVLSKRQQLVADYTRRRLQAMLISQLAELDKVNNLKKLTRQQLTYYRSIEKDLKGQLEGGRSVYARFSEIDVERTKTEQRLNDLKAEHIAIEAELIQLIGTVPDIALPAVPQNAWKQSARKKGIWQDEASVLYPVTIAIKDIQVANQTVAVADAAFNLSYGVQATYKQREESPTFSGDDWFSLQATISIPLWRNTNQIPKLRAAQAEKYRAELAYDDTVRQWIKRMSVLEAEQAIALDNIALLQTRQDAIQARVQAANRNYESGDTPLETVLKAQLDELAITSQLITQRSRYISLSAQFNSHIIEGKYDEND